MKLVTFFLGVLLVVSCGGGPEPLVYGKDACHACKMTLVDNRFGAELVTKKGKVYKFDDVNCLVRFYKAGHVSEQDIQSVLAVDYSATSVLIDATRASYVISGEVRSPMGSNAAVFADIAEARKLNEKLKGKIVGWNEILTSF